MAHQLSSGYQANRSRQSLSLNFLLADGEAELRRSAGADQNTLPLGKAYQAAFRTTKYASRRRRAASITASGIVIEAPAAVERMLVPINSQSHAL